VGFIVRPATGLTVTVPVPVGLIVTFALAGLKDTVLVEVIPTTSTDPANCALTVAAGIVIAVPALDANVIGELGDAVAKANAPPLVWRIEENPLGAPSQAPNCIIDATGGLPLMAFPNRIVTFSVDKSLLLALGLSVKVFADPGFPAIIRSPLPYIAPPMPTPPVTTNAPVAVDELAVPAVIEMLLIVACPLIPTPPVTTNVPVPVVVLAVLAVSVVAEFAASVVNAPVLLVEAPMLALLIVPNVPGLTVNPPAG
jgi:hypothetical protein